MENNQNTQSFEDFARKKLDTHVQELNTRYNSQEPKPDALDEGYNEHRTIFENELTEEMSRMGRSGKQANNAELEKIKSRYLDQLMASKKQ